MGRSDGMVARAQGKSATQAYKTHFYGKLCILPKNLSGKALVAANVLWGRNDRLIGLRWVELGWMGLMWFGWVGWFARERRVTEEPPLLRRLPPQPISTEGSLENRVGSAHWGKCG